MDYEIDIDINDKYYMKYEILSKGDKVIFKFS